MVVENLLPTFLAWLLGPDFENAALPRFLPMAIVLAGLLVVVGSLAAGILRGSIRWAGPWAWVRAALAAIFLGWLVVPGFGSAGVLRILSIAIVLAALLADVVALAAAVRGASTRWPRLTAWAMVALAATPLVFLLILGLARWENAPSLVRGSLVSLGSRLEFTLVRVFGSGWRSAGLLSWWLVIGSLLAGFVVVGYLLATARHGPRRAWRLLNDSLANVVVDLACLSPRRLWALSWLAFRESIRRRVVVVFAIFVVLLLAAGWFLDPSTDNPAKLYVDFVLTASTYLVLLLALFLSVFSLPADIRNRTLHTVVTKPVRSSEIVLGRIVGFVLVGTLLLAAMSVVSFLFAVRGLEHTHELRAMNLQPYGEARDGKPQALKGGTESRLGHRHAVYIDPDGNGRVDPQCSHTHALEASESDGQRTYAVGWTEGMFMARVPIYGNLRFCDLNGVDREKGINVGDEWVYRSYIHGRSRAAAIWTFQNVREDMLNENGELPIEMNIGVFRSHKGNIEKTVHGSLSLRNPKTGLTVEVYAFFPSKEFVPLTLTIPRKMVKTDKQSTSSFSSARMVARKTETPDGIRYLPARDEELDKSLLKEADGRTDRRSFDLFDDLVSAGEVEVWLKCEDSGQYFGAAKPDLYVLANDASFSVNFFKGYFGIWMPMVLIVGFGVMFSTFLSGPVAMIATAGVMVAGVFKDALSEIARGPQYGGGPFESFVRIVTQDNMISPLQPGLKTTVVQMADRMSEFFLGVIGSIIPSLTEFNYTSRVAGGFDISWDPWVLVPAVRALAFLAPLFVAGCFLLKTREVAR